MNTSTIVILCLMIFIIIISTLVGQFALTNTCGLMGGLSTGIITSIFIGLVYVITVLDSTNTPSVPLVSGQYVDTSGGSDNENPSSIEQDVGGIDITHGQSQFSA